MSKNFCEACGTWCRVNGVYSANTMQHAACLSNHHCRNTSGLYYNNEVVQADMSPYPFFITLTFAKAMVDKG